MSIRTLLCLLALSVALPVALPRAASAEETAAAVAPQPPAVSVVAARTDEVVSTAMVTGTLVPRETVVVGTDVDGLRIEELLFDEGDRVEKGAVLARLATDMIEIELARNTSQIARSEAAEAQATSQIAEAESATVEVEAALARTKPLQEKGIVGQDVLDQRISAAAGARARLAAAQQGVAVAKADRALTLAERRELELRKSKAEIKAPTAGLVLSRAARLGQVVSSAGGGLFEMARDGLIELDGEVSETVLNGLAPGQAVKVALAGNAAPIEGTIRLVSPMVDATTRLGRVRIALPPSMSLRSGAFARGVVELARSRGVVVPQTAVVVDAGSAVVQVVADGKVETRQIKIGLSTGSLVEVAEGLAEGETVVAVAGTFVRDGDTVTAVATPERRAEAVR